MKQKRDVLLHIILIYVILSGITYWLPTTRGLFDGTSYTWSGWMGISSTGTGGYYWLLLIFTTLLISVVYFGWRGYYKLFRWLLLLWFIILIMESGSWFFLADDVQVKGDTLGYDTSLPVGRIVFPVDVLFLLLACIWIVRDIRRKHIRNTPIWIKLNRNLLILFFCILPIQFIILRFFDEQLIFDQIGVLLTIFQWFLLNLSFYPWKTQSFEENKIYYKANI